MGTRWMLSTRGRPDKPHRCSKLGGVGSEGDQVNSRTANTGAEASQQYSVVRQSLRFNIRIIFINSIRGPEKLKSYHKK